MKICPICKLINPIETEVCDCGYNFSTGIIKKSENNDKKFQKANVRFLMGMILFNTFAVFGLLFIFIYARLFPYKHSMNLYHQDQFSKITGAVFWPISLIYFIIIIVLNYFLFQKTRRDK